MLSLPPPSFNPDNASHHLVHVMNYVDTPAPCSCSIQRSDECLIQQVLLLKHCTDAAEGCNFSYPGLIGDRERKVRVPKLLRGVQLFQAASAGRSWGWRRNIRRGQKVTPFPSDPIYSSNWRIQTVAPQKKAIRDAVRFPFTQVHTAARRDFVVRQAATLEHKGRTCRSSFLRLWRS